MEEMDRTRAKAEVGQEELVSAVLEAARRLLGTRTVHAEPAQWIDFANHLLRLLFADAEDEVTVTAWILQDVKTANRRGFWAALVADGVTLLNGEGWDIARTNDTWDWRKDDWMVLDSPDFGPATLKRGYRFNDDQVRDFVMAAQSFGYVMEEMTAHQPVRSLIPEVEQLIELHFGLLPGSGLSTDTVLRDVQRAIVECFLLDLIVAGSGGA